MTDNNWPIYYLSNHPDHIHAIGVIAVAYSAYEGGLFRLYAHHPQIQKMPWEMAQLHYTKRPGAGGKKGNGRWGDAETFSMRLLTTVRAWFEDFLQIVMERHLQVQDAMKQYQRVNRALRTKIGTPGIHFGSLDRMALGDRKLSAETKQKLNEELDVVIGQLEGLSRSLSHRLPKT